MRKYIEIFLALAFLAYGLIRVFAGTALLGQEIGLIDFPAFQGPVVDINNFLGKANEKQLIPVSVAGYVSYIALMGLVLCTGAIRSLKNLPFGLSCIGAFIVMYVLLFVNFQTINPKVIHLAICFIMFIALLWLKGSYRNVFKPGNRLESS